VPRIGFDGDVNYRDAEGDCCRAVSGFMVSGTLAIATHIDVSMPGVFLACDRSYPKTAIRFGGTMIDALLNVAVFAVLVLIIVGSGVDCAHRVR
jgi:hypothetical protein